MKYLFLDFDGVLNGGKYPSGNYFNPENIYALNLLLQRFEPKVIVSSSHRLTMKDSELIQMLKENNVYKIESLFFGTTIRQYQKRAKEIKKYIKDNNIDDFIIIDDDPSVGEYDSLKDHWIQVNERTGLTLPDIDNIKNNLQNQGNSV